MIFGLLLLAAPALVCPPKTDKLVVAGREVCAKEKKPLEGTHVVPHPSGKPAITLAFKNGLPHGKWIFTDREGRTELEEEYQEGELHGRSVSYAGGGILEERTWARGVNIGPNTLYYPGGKKAFVETLGASPRQELFGPDGKPFSGEGLPGEVIALMIKAAAPRFTYCYEQRLASSPELKGRVTVDFRIGGEGGVMEPRISETTLRDQKTEACLIKVLSGLRFPRPIGGESIEISFPFAFVPSE